MVRQVSISARSSFTMENKYLNGLFDGWETRGKCVRVSFSTLRVTVCSGTAAASVQCSGARRMP